MCCNILQQINAYIYYYLHYTLKNKVDVYMRCGISNGNIIGSVIDGRSFRLFGSTINKAARLEAICEKNKFYFDKVFYNKLILSKWFKDCNENEQNEYNEQNNKNNEYNEYNEYNEQNEYNEYNEQNEENNKK